MKGLLYIIVLIISLNVHVNGQSLSKDTVHMNGTIKVRKAKIESDSISFMNRSASLNLSVPVKGVDGIHLFRGIRNLFRRKAN
jgi:hypothetical protein